MSIVGVKDLATLAEDVVTERGVYEGDDEQRFLTQLVRWELGLVRNQRGVPDSITDHGERALTRQARALVKVVIARAA